LSVNYRLRFARREPAIWLGHLDLMRTFERTVRRAGLPVVWSQGFNPRPHLAFALPIGVGLATQDDYVDVMMTEPLDEKVLLKRLNDAFPAGFEILDVKVVPAEGPSLMSLIAASDYLLQGCGLAAAANKLADIPEGEPWLVEKNSKGKLVTIDIRPLLISQTIVAEDQLLVRVKAGSRDNLRPDLLLKVLVNLGGLDEQSAADTSVTRLALWIHAPGKPGGQGPALGQDGLLEKSDGTPSCGLIRPFDLVMSSNP
jgi:radical SAM-linked protein